MIEQHPSVFASGEISETKANQIEGIALCMVDSESARGKQCVIKQLRPRSPAAQHEYRRFGTCAVRLTLVGRLLFQNSRRWVHDGCLETGVLDHWDRIMLEFEVGHIRKIWPECSISPTRKSYHVPHGRELDEKRHAALRRSLRNATQHLQSQLPPRPHPLPDRYRWQQRLLLEKLWRSPAPFRGRASDRGSRPLSNRECRPLCPKP
jgi:hypothetical protein